LKPNDWKTVCEQISAVLGTDLSFTKASPVSGGDINKAFILQTSRDRFFVKCNHAELLSMFEAEADGLLELSRADAVRTPTPLCTGTTGGQAYIVMEHIDLGRAVPTSASTLGKRLAKQHRVTKTRFGWQRDNTIGSTPQINTLTDNWMDFLRSHRLGFQLDLAHKKGVNTTLIDKGHRLLGELHQFFTGYTPSPSLLHGDLWGGNVATDQNGEPVIYDPAVYFGDRETDIAMTALFGGFDESFYSAYHDAWPLDPGYATRKNLYNLYHILNHFNLFGGGYAAQAERIVDYLLSAIR
jgi:fructosamine-3-kinase